MTTTNYFQQNQLHFLERNTLKLIGARETILFLVRGIIRVNPSTAGPRYIDVLDKFCLLPVVDILTTSGISFIAGRR